MPELLRTQPLIFLHVFSLSLIQVETSLTSPLCLMTGQKPATANQLHLRQHANSSGVKAHFGREHQPSPNLCPSSFSNHSSSLLPQQPALLSPLLPVNISYPPYASTSQLCLLILFKLFTADIWIFLWREHIWKEKHTSAFILRTPPQPQPALLQESDNLFFFSLLFAASSMYHASLHLWIENW